jgi:alpha-galactosidase
VTEKIVLIGAGSAMFTRGLVADLVRRNQEMELRLVDVDPEALKVAEGLTRKMIAARQAPIRLCASTERRDVLPGATAVIGTVGVGGRRAWEQDILIPRKYGVNQPVGDTVMPGGSSRALRMIHAMVGVARDVLDLAPDALFFNYGNPMSAVCRGIRKATGADMVGLCHGVFHVGGHLAGVLGVDPARISYSAVGINHLTWFTGFWADGVDKMPALLAIADERAARFQKAGADFTSGGIVDGKEVLTADDPFCWHLAHLFRAFPAVGDRHVTEFFPRLFVGGRYYGKTLGVDVFSMEETIRWGDAIYERMREDALSDGPLPADYWDRISGEHEQVIDILDSIRRDTGRIYSVNLPNQGQVPNLPAEAVIECPAAATAGGLRALAQPPLSPGIAGTLATRFAWVETVVEAALEGSRRKFIQALVIDGAVDDLATATALADELLAAQADYLPQFGDRV